MAPLRKNDPYFDHKIYHYAAKLSDAGDASALCYKQSRAIPLNRGQSWTIRPASVTCPRCRALLRENGKVEA
jgi:hypothetical protein